MIRSAVRKRFATANTPPAQLPVASPQFQKVYVTYLAGRFHSFQEIDHIMDLIDREATTGEMFGLPSCLAPSHLFFSLMAEEAHIPARILSGDS